jgi:hypothetical protein
MVVQPSCRGSGRCWWLGEGSIIRGCNRKIVHSWSQYSSFGEWPLSRRAACHGDGADSRHNTRRPWIHRGKTC